MEKIKEWRESEQDDLIEFRPYVRPEPFDESHGADVDEEHEQEEADDVRVDDGTNAGLLFVHQAKRQRRLTSCLLDATYRTTKYSLPLYFLVVNTNVDYRVVASFVTQSETTDAIKEALRHHHEVEP